jgi:hypothetical protein
VAIDDRLVIVPVSLDLVCPITDERLGRHVVADLVNLLGEVVVGDDRVGLAVVQDVLVVTGG